MKMDGLYRAVKVNFGWYPPRWFLHLPGLHPPATYAKRYAGGRIMEPKSITEQLLFSTVRIEVEKPLGVEAGTGFIFSYEKDAKTFLFLVTNKHVVANATAGRFFFTLSDGTKPQIGKRFDIQIDRFTERWYGHPEDGIDITAMPLVPLLDAIQAQGKKVFFKSIPHSLIPTEDQIKELDALEEIIFVGYPSGIFDQKNLMPIMRRGITATPPQLDYEGSPIFVVDASVFPGSSGSPVLICNQGSYSTKGGIAIGTRVLFLGVIAQVVIREEHGEIEIVSIPSGLTPIVKTQQMIDLGIVYKSKAVMETVLATLKEEKQI